MPTTRSFVLEKNDAKKFWDITWDGPLVEITSGKWGTNGRAREQGFESLVERDAYIAAQIARIRKQGYLEIGDIAPAAELATPEPGKHMAAIRGKAERLPRQKRHASRSSLPLVSTPLPISHPKPLAR